MKTVVTILQLLCGLAIILIVLFQSGKSQACPVPSAAWLILSWPRTRPRPSTLSWLALPSGLVLCSWC